jgi:site-specific DNA recombinase
MLAMFAEWERATITERLSAGRRSKRESGGYGGGQVPYGYAVSGQGRDATLVEVPEEQAVIRQVYEALDRGLSLRAVAEVVGVDWNMVRRLKDRRDKETKK